MSGFGRAKVQSYTPSKVILDGLLVAGLAFEVVVEARSGPAAVSCWSLTTVLAVDSMIRR